MNPNQRIMATYHDGVKPYDRETLMNTPYTGPDAVRPVHKRFFRLKFGEKFEINGVLLQKESWRTAVTAYGPEIRTFLWPWTKVTLWESEITKLMRRDATRFAQGIARSLAKSSPFVAMFPHIKHVDDERTGPSC